MIATASFIPSVFAILLDVVSWLVIVMVVLAMALVINGYGRQAHTIVPIDGWFAFWQSIRENVLTQLLATVPSALSHLKRRHFNPAPAPVFYQGVA